MIIPPEVKAGDILIKSKRSIRSLVNVVRLTKTMVIVSDGMEARYLRHCGRRVGVESPTSCVSYVRAPKPGEIEEVRKINRRNKLIDELSNFPWGKLNSQTLEAIKFAIDHA